MAPWYAFPHPDEKRRVTMGAEYRPVPILNKIATAPVQINHLKYPMSHARPVQGGFSGRLEFDLVAETPVLFGMVRDHTGGRQTPITEHVRLHEGKDAPFAAPGRAIKGMIRSVFGIATFSAFKPVNGNHRFFNRNVDYREQFAGAIRGAAEPAWLRPTYDKHSNGIVWALCKVASAPIATRDFVRLLNKGDIVEYYQAQNANVDETKLQVWRALDFKKRCISIGKCVKRESRAISHERPFGNNTSMRYLVTAGRMGTRRNELLFAVPTDAFKPVNETAISAFLMANSKYSKIGAVYPIGGKRKPDRNFLYLLCDYLFALGQRDAQPMASLLGLDWQEVERSALRRDNPPGIPVHVHGDPEDAGFEIGTSKLVPKGPRTSVVGLLAMQQPPLDDGVLDWADALFGRIDESDKETTNPFAAIASRLDFDFAPVVNPLPPGGHECLPHDQAIRVLQGSPKGSFDPFMLARKDARGQPAGWAGENSEVAGHKRYPACMDVDPAFATDGAGPKLHAVVVRSADGKSLGENVPIPGVGDMESLVRPLKAGTRYRAGVDFHNLHPLELGALLWALSFGDARVFTDREETCYRHVGGRLRAKGLGRLRPTNAWLAELERNPLPEELLAADTDIDGLAIKLMTVFEIAMGRFLAGDSGLHSGEARERFYGCETIRALLNLSNAAWSNQPEVIAGLHSGNAKRGEGGMFHLPEGKFPNFAAIRRNLYKETSGFLPEGQKSILSEFLDPPASPPARAEQGLECLLDPAMELEGWRARLLPDKNF
jgi:CRISPR-associated protein (TIGR03986 family)